MIPINFKEIEGLLNNGDLKFYNFYNSDLDTTTFLATQYYLNNPEDTYEVNQNLHIIFIDIEVYHEDRSIKFEFDKSDHPINAITLYDTKYNQYFSFYLLRDINRNKFGNVEDIVKRFKEYLTAEKYDVNNEKLNIIIYDDELKLIQDAWTYIKKSNPIILSGFNSDNFDYPYIYRRLIKLKDKAETAKILSNFNYVEFRNQRLKIPDYPIVDLLYLYRPRAEGGLNLGSTLASYTLDNISEVELGLNKLEYKGQVTDLNKFYEENPEDYLLYNIVDVALCKLLNQKLKHIELQNSLRRIMKIPFSNSMIGSSALFDGYTLFRLTKENKRVRHGLVTQYNKSITVEDLKSVPRPATKKNDIVPIGIPQREYISIITKFDGAYVKQPVPRIVKGTIIDLDATSLYPSKILESNIGFDTYRARIINPLVYKLLGTLEQYIGIKPIPNVIYSNFYQLVEKYAETNKKKISNILKFKKQWYYTIMYLFLKLIEANIPINKIYEPVTDEQAYLLMFYLNPLLDIFQTLHPEREVFNPFVYDYLFDNEENLKKKYPILYIITHADGGNQKIEKVNVQDCIKLISQYSVTICGTCFEKHEHYIGLYSDMLINMGNLRKEFRAKLKDFKKGSEQFDFYNARQLAVKVIMNSSYGTYGLSSFRYSNHWLAQSITSQGRLTIKLAQYMTEQFLRNKYTS